MKKIVYFVLASSLLFSSDPKIGALQRTTGSTSPTRITQDLIYGQHEAKKPQLRITYSVSPQQNQAIEQQIGEPAADSLLNQEKRDTEQAVSPAEDYTEEELAQAPSDLTTSVLDEDGFYGVEDMNRSIELSDISSPEGQWQNVPEQERSEKFKVFADNSYQHTAQQTSYGARLEPPVRSLRIFRPNGVIENSSKELTLWIHGTFAHKGKAYTNQEHDEFKAVKNFVESQAKIDGAIDHLINYAWSGHLSDEDREHGGLQLANFLNTFGKNYQKITVIAHSHGCNVVNIASHTLKPGIKIDKAIYFAGPVREDEKDIYKPTEKIRKIYNFYSTNDPVQLVGSLSLPTFGARMWDFYTGRRYNTDREIPNIINIDSISNGIPQDHSKIRMLLEFLYKILNIIDTNYRNCTDLKVYTLSDSQGLPLDAKVTLPQEEIIKQQSLRKLSDLERQKIEEYSDAMKETLSLMIEK